MALREPALLYDSAQSRAVDRCAIETHGIPGPQLMARAARAAFRELLARVPSPARLQVLCGAGNNGGDGLLVAALAAGRGIPVNCYLVDGEPRSADAMEAAARARAAGCELQAFVPGSLQPEGVVVDAMLGTGIRGAVREPFAAAINAVNALGQPVLALDMPSGLEADTGHAADPAVTATWTVSFITGKRGLYTALGPDQAGERILDDLDIPAAAYDVVASPVRVLDLAAERASLPALPRAAHKGLFGRLLVVGGDHGMGGAVLLAAEAALRSGVGLLRVATREAHISPLLARTPEAMPVALRGRNDLEPSISWAHAIALGPGLGTGPWGEQLLRLCLGSGKPLLLDADALNLLAQFQLPVPSNAVLTPHPGEAARLLGTDAASVQRDRFAAADALLSLGAGAVILKGVGSLVAGGGELALCPAGNAGMASGGMGDVLSGIVGALLAQGLAPAAAARLACVLHARAGDAAAARLGERALLASDLPSELPELLR